MGYLTFLRHNARFLAFGLAMTFCSSFGQTYFIGVFGESILTTFSISHGDFGLLYMFATIGSAALLGTVGRVIDVIDLRLFATLVCAGVVGACFLMSTVDSLACLVGALFALRFTGQGLMGHTAFTSMGRYFDEGRGKAISIAGLGFSAGNAVFPPLGVALLAAYSWREVWHALGLATAVLLIPLVLWLLKGQGERHATWLRRETLDRDPPTPADRVASEVRRPQQWTRSDVLRDPRFYLLIPAVLSPAFLLTGLFFHQGFVAESKGWSREWLAGWFVGFGVAGSLTSLALGSVVDRLGARRMVQLYLLPLGLALLALATSRHPAAAGVYMVLAGINAGAAAPTLGSLWAELYGVFHLGSIRALTSALMVISTAVAPPILGSLIDAGHSAAEIAWMGCGYVAVGVGLIAVAMRRAR